MFLTRAKNNVALIGSTANRSIPCINFKRNVYNLSCSQKDKKRTGQIQPKRKKQINEERKKPKQALRFPINVGLR